MRASEPLKEKKTISKMQPCVIAYLVVQTRTTLCTYYNSSTSHLKVWWYLWLALYSINHCPVHQLHIILCIRMYVRRLQMYGLCITNDYVHYIQHSVMYVCSLA